MTEPTLQAMIDWLLCKADTSALRDEDEDEEMCVAIADRLRAMQWRPVTETEPANDVPVIVGWGDDPHCAVLERIYGTTWRYPGDEKYYRTEWDEPTRFMPLPPPPEGGQ